MDRPGPGINQRGQIGAVTGVAKDRDFFAVLGDKGSHLSINRGEITVHHIIAGMVFGDNGQFVIIDDVLNLLGRDVVGKGDPLVIQVLQVAVVKQLAIGKCIFGV